MEAGCVVWCVSNHSFTVEKIPARVKFLFLDRIAHPCFTLSGIGNGVWNMKTPSYKAIGFTGGGDPSWEAHKYDTREYCPKGHTLQGGECECMRCELCDGNAHTCECEERDAYERSLRALQYFQF